MRVFIAVLLLAGAGGCRERVIQHVAESHVDANVPSASDFDRLLRRDLAAYFSATTGKAVTVEYELLRDGPTQTGIAYPKFYVWVRTRTSDGALNQGAARLAAMDRKQFQVTDFLSEPDIRARPADIYQVFPGPVCQKIRSRLGIEG